MRGFFNLRFENVLNFLLGLMEYMDVLSHF